MNAPSPGFAVAPLTPAIGGLVTGLDLARPLSDAIIIRLRVAVADRHVLFFEGQTLEPAAQRAFASRFGKLHVHPVYPRVDGVPEITLIETRPDDLPDNDNWHTDVTFIEKPPFGAVLTPRILPSSGGDTLWGSNVAAYEALSAPLRKLLDGLTAEHSFETGFPRRRWGVGRRDVEDRASGARHVRADRSLRPGRRSLGLAGARQRRPIARRHAISAPAQDRASFGPARNPHRHPHFARRRMGDDGRGELIAATRGIGYLIMSASQFLATDVVFVGIGIIAADAFAFTFAMRLLEAWLVPWKGQN
jgi:hypothetical protein